MEIHLILSDQKGLFQNRYTIQSKYAEAAYVYVEHLYTFQLKLSKII